MMRKLSLVVGLGAAVALSLCVSHSADAPRKRALLVGINQYRNSKIRRLQGCRNDVEGMRAALLGNWGFETKDIQMLEDSQATYANIVTGLQDLIRMTGAGDTVVFEYSGHGSTDPSSAAASGTSETIVPYDSRDPKNMDITAAALSGLIGELGKKTKNVTVILDSCYSGHLVSATRTINDQVEVRQIDPPSDPAPPPPPPAAGSGERTMSTANRFEPLDDSYVLMYSALPTQTAKEYVSGGRSYGAMTFFLLQEMGLLPKPTYRGLMDIVAQRVADVVADQTPKAAGPNAGNYLFGTEAPSELPYTLARSQTNGVRLPYSGAAHGVAVGARYDVYAAPSAAGSTQKAAASIEVTNVLPFASDAKVTSGAAPEFGYAVLRERGVKAAPLRVWLDPSPKLQGLRARLAGSKQFQVSEQRKSVNVQVTLEKNGIGLYTADGFPLFDAKSPLGSDTAVEKELNAWLNWFSVMGLQNPAPGLKVSYELTAEKREGTPLPQLEGPGMVVRKGDVLVPVVRNDSDQPLYIMVVGLSSDRSVGVVFPAGADAKTPFRLKAHSGNYSLPKIEASVPGCLDGSRDVLILLASTQPVEFSVYAQDGFCPKPNRVFSQVNLGRQGWTTPPGSWTTVRKMVEIKK